MSLYKWVNLIQRKTNFHLNEVKHKIYTVMLFFESLVMKLRIKYEINTWIIMKNESFSFANSAYNPCQQTNSPIASFCFFLLDRVELSCNNANKSN